MFRHRVDDIEYMEDINLYWTMVFVSEKHKACEKDCEELNLTGDRTTINKKYDEDAWVGTDV